MAERLATPIYEPYIPPPILEPNLSNEVIGDPPYMGEALEFALTKSQRDWVIRRDGGKCQATTKHKCNQDLGLEVDHIMPQRYSYELGIDPDFPENCLSKCKNAHNIKHPDRIETLQRYHELKEQGIDAFKQLGLQRDELLKKHQVYWNTENDRTDTVRAIQLTQRYKKTGEVWPEKRIAGTKKGVIYAS